MEKFNKKFYGYDPNQVKSYLDNITSQVENMVIELKKKDEEIAKLKNHMMNNITTSEEKMKELNDKIEYYEKLENTFNRAILIAQDTGDQIKEMAKKESEHLIAEAKNNADRIVNSALNKADRTIMNAERLNRSIQRYKERFRTIAINQIKEIDEIEILEIEDRDDDNITVSAS